MRYSIGQDMIFVILALISTLALLSKHAVIAVVFFALALIFVIYEHQIFQYIRSA